MKEPSELAKALDVILKNSAVEQNSVFDRNGYATPPIVTYGDEAGPEDEVHLRDYWLMVRKRLWLVIGLAVIVSSLAAIRQARQPDIYQAQAQVQINPETNSPALGASRGEIYSDNSVFMDPEYFNTQVKILSSPTLLRRVAKTLDLEHNRNFLDPRVERRSTWRSVASMFGFGEESKPPAKSQLETTAESNRVLTSAASVDDADEVDRLAPYVDSLQGMLDVAQVRQTRLIDIRASH